MLILVLLLMLSVMDNRRFRLENFEDTEFVKLVKISPLPLHDHDIIYDQLHGNHGKSETRKKSGPNFISFQRTDCEPNQWIRERFPGSTLKTCS